MGSAPGIAFPLSLTMICQFANQFNSPPSVDFGLVLKMFNERWNYARDGFMKLDFVMRVSSLGMPSHFHSP
jgi:hypothetical protein